MPEHRTDHPLGCHRSRIPERVVFEKLVQVLVFGCAYERIADGSCSEVITSICLQVPRGKRLVEAANDAPRVHSRRFFRPTLQSRDLLLSYSSIYFVIKILDG